MAESVEKKMRRSRFRPLHVLMNLLLASVSFLLCFGVTEFFLRSSGKLPNRASKGIYETENGLLNCWPSDPHRYYPIDLSREGDRAAVERIILPREDEHKKVERISGITPYCIVYDHEKRKRGLFEGRPRTAAVVGDSFAFGSGVNDEDTLSHALGEEYPEFNFQNFARPAASVRNVSWQVEEIIRDLPDARTILYFYNINDVLLSPELKERRSSLVDLQLVRWRHLKSSRDAWFGSVLRESAVWGLLEQGLALRRETRYTIQHYLDSYFSDENRPELDRSLEFLVTMNEKSTLSAKKLYIILYPLLHKNLFGSYPFKPIHEKLMGFCAKRGLECIDALPAFESHRSMKPFIVHEVDYHPNGAANRVVSKFLHETVGLDIQ